MTNGELPPQQQQTQSEAQNRTAAEQETSNRNIAALAINGIASVINIGRANIVERRAAHTARRADRAQRRLEAAHHTHQFVNGTAEQSGLELSELSLRERGRIQRTLVKSQNAEWGRKNADIKASANSGLGRVSRDEKRNLQRDMQYRGFAGEISLKEMNLNRELIKLGGHVVIDGETHSIAASKPRGEVTRAYKRADRADRRSLRTLDISKREKAIAEKRRNAAELNRRAEELRRRRQT